ncbi:MAG: hypothetical protein HKO72_10695, partial [Flavobacteriaceae bacterium]|nr:hypothetical protein [Bacteroidia bacterium]NNL61789.1 hypothetical protein [Flavobacteriaceae bacterium]
DAQLLSTSGKMVLWAGDANGDGVMRYLGAGNDTNGIKDDVLAPENGNTTSSNFYPYLGYENSDIDMNGQIRYLGPGNDSNFLKDIILIFPANTGQSNFFPINEQIPD